MPDQIYTSGPLPAPLKYTVPGTQKMIPRAFQALFDGSGASGDYVPTVVIRSQAGHVIARAILGETVTAGDDAEVSWFPHVGGRGGGAAGLASCTVEVDASAGTVPIGTTDLTFTTMHATTAGVFEIDAGDATVVNFLTTGFFMAAGHIGFNNTQVVAGDTHLRLTGNNAPAWTDDIAEALATAGEPAVFSFLEGVTFYNILFPPRGMRFTISADVALPTWNGAGLEITRLSTATV